MVLTYFTDLTFVGTRRHRRGHVSGVSRAAPPPRLAQARQAGLQAAVTPGRVRAELLLRPVSVSPSLSPSSRTSESESDVDIFDHLVVGLVYANLIGVQDVTVHENLVGASLRQ